MPRHSYPSLFVCPIVHLATFSMIDYSLHSPRYIIAIMLEENFDIRSFENRLTRFEQGRFAHLIQNDHVNFKNYFGSGLQGSNCRKTYRTSSFPQRLRSHLDLQMIKNANFAFALLTFACDPTYNSALTQL